MVNLLYTELLKLKRSNMFLISMIGAAVAPFMIVLAFYIEKQSKPSAPPANFDVLFLNVNMYTALFMGVLLYGVVTAYLFNREYTENTLKNLLTIPVSRFHFIMSKFILLFLWIMILTIIAWGLTLLLGLLGGFPGLNSILLFQFLVKFLISGGFLFILSSPIVLVTFIMKTYVPPIILTIVIALINVLTASSEHKDLFPWTAALDIVNNDLQPTYPPEYSYINIITTSLIGFIATIFYFKKIDIH
ncbi:ABC transporter permease [Bacillus cytotoxicus]|uniref:ABC transporter permease n=1 Tax=Bacillus cereus group sp. BfR-BA-01492 TaxID=2920361 RepID=UPI001F587CE9|nr:ABC transporter permease [Bacillus cereus group sp. BfR-BA-01492]EMA6345207.1 ABC transporter permease [Bacillus cytotoxicus]EMA6345384.1 ABC transporter permease [Bacillus cytotoxicus]